MNCWGFQAASSILSYYSSLDVYLEILILDFVLLLYLFHVIFVHLSVGFFVYMFLWHHAETQTWKYVASSSLVTLI